MKLPSAAEIAKGEKRVKALTLNLTLQSEDKRLRADKIASAKLIVRGLVRGADGKLPEANVGLAPASLVVGTTTSTTTPVTVALASLGALAEHAQWVNAMPSATIEIRYDMGGNLTDPVQWPLTVTRAP